MPSSVQSKLQQTLHDATFLFNSLKLDHALIGGLACSLHGRTRVTDDVDILLLCDQEQAFFILEHLDRSPFETLFPDVDSVIRRSFILPLLHRDTQVPVDVSIGVSGFENQIVKRARPIDIGGEAIRVATPEDLLLMKILARRPQDLTDIDGIVGVQKERIDWDYCINTAQQLGEAVDEDIVRHIESIRQRRRG